MFRAFKDSWSVNSFKKRYEKGEINFDNPIQRGVVWDKKDSSLYIHSLLYDILIYQKPFLVSKKPNGWDVLDGKQRGTSLIRYINNEYSLTGLQNEPLIEVDGIELNINGKYFKQLPDELQMKILDFQIEMAVLENAETSMEALFFNRSNSGKAMAKIDLARSKNKSIDVVKHIGKHPIFKAMFSEKALLKLPQDEIVVKTWQSLYENEPDFSSKHFSQLMETLNITEEDTDRIIYIYDTMLSVYKTVFFKNKEIGTAILRKTHFLAIVPYVEEFQNNEQFTNWCLKFFKAPPREYTQTTLQQTTSIKHYAIRKEIIGKSIEEFKSQYH